MKLAGILVLAVAVVTAVVASGGANVLLKFGAI